jgi:phosphoserine phosphatase RsbU/P
VTNEVRLSRLGTRLAGLLSAEDSATFRRELEAASPDAAFDVLDRLADRLADLRESGVAFADRTLQLELALGVLRERDKAAAEQSEWDFAADLQTVGLPNDFPPYPERRDFDVYAGMVTAKEVGGDLYDFFFISPDRFAFVVADAAGKGLPAAIFITLTRTLLRAAAARIAAPGDCLRMVNAMLCVDNPTLMFSTAFFAVLDTASGELQYANAGHNPPYVMRKGGAIELVPSQGAMALGIMEERCGWRRANPWCAFPTASPRRSITTASCSASPGSSPLSPPRPVRRRPRSRRRSSPMSTSSSAPRRWPTTSRCSPSRITGPHKASSP